MQNNYETIMIINSTMEEAAIKSTIEKIKDLISANGAVESVEEWGNKKLAYPVKKHSEGYYVLMTFEAEPTLVQEIKRIAGIVDGVIRRLITKR